MWVGHDDCGALGGGGVSYIFDGRGEMGRGMRRGFGAAMVGFGYVRSGLGVCGGLGEGCTGSSLVRYSTRFSGF